MNRQAYVLGTVSTVRGWRSELAAHVREHVDSLTIRVIRDAEQLATDPFDAVIVDDVTSWITRPHLERAVSRGVQVIGVYDASESEGQGERYLEGLGVAHTVPEMTAAEDLTTLVLRLLDSSGAAAAPGSSAPSSGSDAVGGITVVGGPAGSGVTEVSIGLAACLINRGQRVILVDLDDRSASLAVRLRLEPSPHIHGAIDAAGRGEDVLDHVARQPDGRQALPFHVVVGSSRTEEWARVRDDELVELLGQLRRWDHAVVNVGSEIETGGQLGASRHPATRAALRHGDRVIGVCDASAAHAVSRYLDWFADAIRVMPSSGRILTAVNKIPARAASRRHEVEEAVCANTPADRRAGFAWMPFDRSLATAAWSGHVTAGRQFRREIDTVAALLASRPRGATRRGVGRRARTQEAGALA